MKRHASLWLTLFLAVFYVLLGNSRVTSGDGEAMLQVTRALAQRGRLDLPPGILPPVETILADTTDTQIPYTVVGHDGRTYAKYGLGQSLAAMPLYYLGMAWRALTGTGHAPRSAALLLNSFLTAGTAGLLLLLVRDLGYSTQAGFTVALAFALCSPAWVYTHTFFSEPLVTFCLTVAAAAIVRFQQRGLPRWLVLAAGALGMALLTRINAVAALPAFGLYLVLTWRAQGVPLRLIIRQALAGLAAFSVGGGLVLWYNVHRFGNPLDFGYHTSNWQTPFFRGLYGLTFSPGKGILWYALPILLGLIGLRLLAQRKPREALLCVGVLAGYLLFHSPYTHWAGGWSWGPRLLLPALPLAILPVSALVDLRGKSQAMEAGLALILVLGLLVQVPAVGSNYAHALQRTYAIWGNEFGNRVDFDPANSPLIGQWRSMLEVTANLRDPVIREQIAGLLATAEPDDSLMLADSPSDALRLQRQAILAFNLPDLWLVTAPWLREEPFP